MSQPNNTPRLDPREEVLSQCTVEVLKYLAREFDITRKGRKEDIIHRFLTSFIPLRMLLGGLQMKDLVLLSKQLGLSPPPRNRSEAIERIYHLLTERFNRENILECIGHKYHLIRPIGEGGLGVVFLAQEALTGRVAVIKHAQLPEGISSLNRELRVLALLDHPNTERLYTYETCEKCPHSLFLVLEYCGDLSLEKALFEKRIPFSAKEKAGLIEQALSGLVYFHQRDIIHGDVSVSNISLLPPEKYRDSWLLKFIDFGASRIGYETLTNPIRNDRYTAPEVHKTPPTTSSDVFSLSVVIAEILAQEVLFTDKEQKSDLRFIKTWLDKHIPVLSLRQVLTEGLQPRPDKRIRDGVSLRKKWQVILDRK
jgi:serine/threonine protein kinase